MKEFFPIQVQWKTKIWVMHEKNYFSYFRRMKAENSTCKMSVSQIPVKLDHTGPL